MSKVLFLTILILLLLMQVATSCQAPPDEPAAEISDTSPTPTKASDIVSRDATAASRITPAPPATLSAEFLEQERVYGEWMQTRVAEGVLTPTVTPTATPIPTPIPAKTPGYVIYQSAYRDPKGSSFRVTYAIDEWKLEYDEMFTGDRLLNLQTSECIFLLRPVPGAAEGIKRFSRETNLQDQAWEVWHFPKMNLIGYKYSEGGNYFYVALEYPKNADSQTIATCQQAVEEVLSTFEFAVAPHRIQTIEVRLGDGHLILQECNVLPNDYQNWEMAKTCFGFSFPHWTDDDEQQLGIGFLPEIQYENAAFGGLRQISNGDVYEARQTGFHADSDEPLEFSLFKNNTALLILNSDFTTYSPSVSLLDIDGQIAWEFANPNNPTVIFDGRDLRDVYDVEKAYVPYELNGKLLFVAEKKGKYVVFYDGRQISPEYDEVEIAYCCGPAGYSIQRRVGMYWFWAMRENQYYLVLISEN